MAHVNYGFTVAGTGQNTAVIVTQRKMLARSSKVLSAGISVDHPPKGGGPIVGRDPGGSAFFIVYRHIKAVRYLSGLLAAGWQYQNGSSLSPMMGLQTKPRAHLTLKLTPLA